MNEKIEEIDLLRLENANLKTELAIENHKKVVADIFHRYGLVVGADQIRPDGTIVKPLSALP